MHRRHTCYGLQLDQSRITIVGVPNPSHTCVLIVWFSWQHTSGGEFNTASGDYVQILDTVSPETTYRRASIQARYPASSVKNSGQDG